MISYDSEACYLGNNLCIDRIILYYFIKIMGQWIKGHEAGRGAAARGVTVKPTSCGFGPHSRR